MFFPKVLEPEPEKWFVRELKKIDPDLRVNFGYSRYFVKRWAVERRTSPERYFSMYASILSSDEPRIIQQAIYDTDQPTFDAEGNQSGFEIIGYRDFDLAPEYEWVMFTDRLDESILGEIKRSYAWERNHPISRLALEKKREEEAKQQARAKVSAEIGLEGMRQGWKDQGLIVDSRPIKTVLEGSEIEGVKL